MERPGPVGAGVALKNRMLARLPRPALVSNRKVHPSIGVFSRNISVPGERRHASAEQIGRF
jgi:hypothetical protein